MKIPQKPSRLVFSAILIGCLPLAAQPKLGPNHRPPPAPTPKHHPSHNDGYFSLGLSLPDGSIQISVGNHRYYEHRGTFYQRGPSGYHVVKAPIGARVPHLPPGCVRIYVDGLIYFRFGDVYYRQVHDSYLIVDTPTIMTNPPPITNAESYQSVWLDETEYLFKDGQFFVKTEQGLVWVEAPLGATTKVLPSDAKSIWYQEIEYFEFEDIFFRKTPDGYKVVTKPWDQ